jgi:hypothetical protein
MAPLQIIGRLRMGSVANGDVIANGMVPPPGSISPQSGNFYQLILVDGSPLKDQYRL